MSADIINFKVNEDRLIQTFMDLVKITSPSKSERLVADYLVNYLNNLGLELTEDNAGKKLGGNCGNLYCRVPATQQGAIPFAILTHMDTVVPCENTQPVLKDGVISVTSPTVLGADDKAGIAEVLELITVLIENQLPHGEIELVFTISEETYMHGARNLDVSWFHSKYALILDEQGAPGVIINQAPYLYTLNVTVHGKAAHAGMCPEDGINAIQMASRAISLMTLGRLDDETTANIGLIQGGFARNIVPNSVYIEGESRSLNRDKVIAQVQHMETCFKTAAEELKGTVTLDIQESFPGYEVPKDCEFIQMLVSATEQTGLKSVIRHSGGGTDANVLNKKGIQSVVLSMGFRDMHTVLEHVFVEDLHKTVLWLNNIQYQLSQELWIKRLT